MIMQVQRFLEFLAAIAAALPLALHSAVQLLVPSETIESRETLIAFLADERRRALQLFPRAVFQGFLR